MADIATGNEIAQSESNADVVGRMNEVTTLRKDSTQRGDSPRGSNECHLLVWFDLAPDSVGWTDSERYNKYLPPNKITCSDWDIIVGALEAAYMSSGDERFRMVACNLRDAKPTCFGQRRREGTWGEALCDVCSHEPECCVATYDCFGEYDPHDAMRCLPCVALQLCKRYVEAQAAQASQSRAPSKGAQRVTRAHRTYT